MPFMIISRRSLLALLRAYGEREVASVLEAAPLERLGDIWLEAEKMGMEIMRAGSHRGFPTGNPFAVAAVAVLTGERRQLKSKKPQPIEQPDAPAYEPEEWDLMDKLKNEPQPWRKISEEELLQLVAAHRVSKKSKSKH